MSAAEPLFVVIEGPSARRAFWPAAKAVPAGWAVVAPPGTLAACAVALDELARRPAPARVPFSLMLFGGHDAAGAANPYDLLLRVAEFADRHDFAAVWLPERHFDAIGSLYPNPAVLHAALAVLTRRVRLRAGSVVLPLHHPARVAEEWAVVDQLSGGRVEVSFAPGWNSADFALAPGTFADRYRTLESAIGEVRRYWAGDAVAGLDGDGRPVAIRTYPRPVQVRLPVWVTVANARRNFEAAGRLGADVLTHLFEHDAAELGEKVAAYRRARADAGHDPHAGRVAVALHTFVCDDPVTVRDRAEAPYCAYLRSHAAVLGRLAAARNVPLDLSALSGAELGEVAAMLYDKFLRGRSLIGPAADCRATVAALAAVGVTEVAGLVDFGPSAAHILEALPPLAALAAGLA